MSTTHQKTEQISLFTEAKLRFNPSRRLVTIEKKTGKYIDELWLKFLMEVGALDGYKMTKTGKETEIELTFAVEEN